MVGMTRRQRCLMIGAGGMAAAWIRRILPPFSERLEIVGLVDVSASALAESGDFLGLAPARRFSSMEPAFETLDADFCVVVVPAAFHLAAAALAAKRGLPILCEKPLAATWTDCGAIYHAVSAARVKMEVVQNYRYHAAMVAMKGLLRGGVVGRINYLVARFADDCRDYDAWHRRHELPHAMLMDGAAHHFDMLRNLSGADCAQLTALEWNPPWSNSTGEFNALSMMQMTNGCRATYEGNATAAGQQNSWHQEYYRAEGEAGAVTIDADEVVRVHRHTRGQTLQSEAIAVPGVAHEGHAWIVAEFLDWLEGGPTPATTLDDNMRTAAMIFAAIESAKTGQTIDVEHMLNEVLTPAAALPGGH